MARSYSAAVEEIKNRCNIVDVIGSVVQLKKAGANHKGLCPFHNEKTPSFSVSESRQFFNCFGCGAKGDVISFVQRYYNLSFQEAVEKLAAQYGIEIQELYDRQGKEKEPYYEANRQAARFFFTSLTGKRNPGYEYLAKRELKPETIKAFGLGYADANWTSLTDHLKAGGVTDEMLIELGLASSKDGRVYDRFRGRVIFPIINTRGKVIGFGGRIIGEGEPKYLNSPESLVFQKKFNLYALNLTRGDIQRENCAILVEGYMDAVALWQAGVKNVAASLGTALTPEQAKLLSRYTERVILCYDADAAGIKAALRGIDILREAGLEVRVLHVDDGKDPDEYIKKHGRDAFLALAKTKAVPDIDYKIALARKKYDAGDTVQRVKLLKSIVTILKPLSPVEADLYIQKVSRELNVSEGALRTEVSGSAKEPSGQNAPQPKKPAEERKSAGAAERILERNLLRLSLVKSEYFAQMREYPEAIVTDEGAQVFDALGALYRPDADFDLAALRARLDEDGLDYLASVLSEVRIGENDAELFADCLRRLDANRAQKREKEIIDILSMADNDTDPAALNALMQELEQLRRRK